MRRENGIRNIEETARFFRKSKSWVYKNWEILGGMKLGGSLIFPVEEDLYERLFCKREGLVEVRLHHQRKPVYRSLLQVKKRGSESRGGKKGGNNKSAITTNDPNRHGLLGVSKCKA